MTPGSGEPEKGEDDRDGDAGPDDERDPNERLGNPERGANLDRHLCILNTLINRVHLHGVPPGRERRREAVKRRTIRRSSRSCRKQPPPGREIRRS